MNFDKLNKIISGDKTWAIKNENQLAPNAPNVSNQNMNPNLPKNVNPGSQVKGNVNVQRLSQYLPSQDPVKLKIAISSALRGRRLNNIQLMSLGNAFVDLLKANPQETMQVMNLLKKVSIEAEGEPNEEV